MARIKEQEIPQNLVLRFDPKLRYLTEIAMRLRGMSLRQYVEDAVVRSFESVSLLAPVSPEPLYDGTGPDDAIAAPPPPRDEAQERAHSLAVNADSLWHENPYVRLEVLALVRPHLLTTGEQQLFDYIHSRTELRLPAESGKGYRMDRNKIMAQWPELKIAATKPMSNKKRSK